MLVLLLILHLLVRPAYAEDATPSASLSPTPVVSIIPTDTPVAVSVTPVPTELITLTEEPTETPKEKPRKKLTPTPTEVPVTVTPTPTKQPLVVAQVTPTPTPLPGQLSIPFIEKPTFMSLKTLGAVLTADKGNYYPATTLPKEETRNLLLVSGLSGMLGLLLISWEQLVAFAARFKPKKIWTDDVSYAINEI